MKAHLKEQKDAYSKVVSQIYKPRLSEQLQAEREQRIRETDKEAFKRKKIEIQSSPYKDYFQEAIKKPAKEEGKVPVLHSVELEAMSAISQIESERARVDPKSTSPVQSKIETELRSENRRRGVR